VFWGGKKIIRGDFLDEGRIGAFNLCFDVFDVIYEFLDRVIRRKGGVWWFFCCLFVEQSSVACLVVSKCLYGSQIHLDIYSLPNTPVEVVAICIELK
jgi:hypothetical protein